MLVFFRSADWSSACKGQLVELQESKELLRQSLLGLAAISVDSTEVLTDFARRKGIDYPLLSDPDSKIIRDFGILDETMAKQDALYGVPHPVTYIVDRKGVVVARKFDEDRRQRYTAAAILTEALKIRPGAAKSQVENNHLKLTASATNAKVKPGQKIRLLLDVELKPKMHVYAPGVKGYIPIQWNVTETPAAQAAAPLNPPSRRLHLEAIDETVDVYEGRFTLQRELTLGSEGALMKSAGQITIEGTLRYQACDERMCYLPQTVPLKWTLQYEPHDTQRVPPELRRRL